MVTSIAGQLQARAASLLVAAIPCSITAPAAGSARFGRRTPHAAAAVRQGRPVLCRRGLKLGPRAAAGVVPLNLRAAPRATIQVGQRVIPVTAEQASPEEKRRLWPMFTARDPTFARYQQRTARDIPLLILAVIPSPA
jgi:hypothetical protein